MSAQQFEAPVTVGQLVNWLKGKPRKAIVGISSLHGAISSIHLMAYYEQPEAPFRAVLGPPIMGTIKRIPQRRKV